MEFERKTIKTHEVRTVEIHETVTCEPMPWHYGNKGQTWQPTAIRMGFISDRIDGGDWSPWTTDGPVRVFGYNIKSGGSRGADRDETHWSTAGPFADRAAQVVAELNAGFGEPGMPAPYSGDVAALP